MTFRAFLPSCAVSAMLALPGAALPPLSQNAEITEGLIAVGMALELSDRCDGLSARTLRGVFYLNGLKNAARSAGYPDAQIDAFVDDRAERTRLEGIARDRLAALGATQGDADSYCRVGRDQIAAGSQVGRLLKD